MIVTAIGYAIGRLKIKGSSLGVTAGLFAGQAQAIYLLLR